MSECAFSFNLSWQSNSIFLRTTGWISQTQVLFNNFAVVEHHSIFLLVSVFLSKTLKTEMASKCKNFQVFLRIIHFVLQNHQLLSIEMFLLIESYWLQVNAFSSIQRKPDEPKYPWKEYLSDSSSFWNLTSLKAATVRISSVNASINSFVFVQDDPIPISSFFIPPSKVW